MNDLCLGILIMVLLAVLMMLLTPVGWRCD